ncbi:MAG: hypothetical protein ABSG03_02640 [Bryobacteraceae bacterium]|jgi:hypothetical protein
MIEVLALGIAMAFAGYLMFPRSPRPISRDDLLYYRRLSDEKRRNEIHPFE